DASVLAQNLGTEIDNAFDPDRAATPLERGPVDEGKGLSATSWTGVAGRGGEEGAPDLESYVAAQDTLSEHLTRQAMILLADPIDRLIAAALIDALDEAGYFVGDLIDLAERLGASVARGEAALVRVQSLEPPGGLPRGLAECLARQLIERDRCHPAMRPLIETLPILAKRDMPALRR